MKVFINRTAQLILRDGEEARVAVDVASATIKSIRVVVARVDTTRKWWIVAEEEEDDIRFTDIGPFDRLKVALGAMLLLKD